MAAVSAPAQADVAPPGKPMSNYEVATGNQLARDCGYSAPLPGDPTQALWLFCDTAHLDANGDPIEPWPFWPGTYAAVGPYTAGQVPTSLSHLPSPPGTPSLPNANLPSHFLPNPTDLVDTEGNQCLFQATWALGLAQGPAAPVTLRNGSTPVQVNDASHLLFVPFIHVCVIEDAGGNWSGLDLIPKRFGLAAYDPATNEMVATSIVHQVSSPTGTLPWQQNLFHPTFSGGHMYLYSYNCDVFVQAFAACTEGRAGVARAPLSSLSQGGAYQYWSDAGWTSSAGGADDMLPPRDSGLGTWQLDVGDFTAQGKGYLLMEQLSMGGHYTLWQAPTPTGPWTAIRTDVMPGCPAEPNYGCYHLWSHPELSTTGGLMYSFYDMKNAAVTLTLLGNVPDI